MRLVVTIIFGSITKIRTTCMYLVGGCAWWRDVLASASCNYRSPGLTIYPIYRATLFITLYEPSPKR
jgi:hypothetical protein